MKGKRGDSRVAKMIAGENRPEPLSRAAGKGGGGGGIPGSSGRSHLGRSKNDAPTIIINVGNSDDQMQEAQRHGELKGGMLGAALAKLAGAEQQQMPEAAPQMGPGGPPPGPMPPMPPAGGGIQGGPPMMPPPMPQMPAPGPGAGVMPPMKRGGRYT